MTKQTWCTPVLKDYGLAAKITQGTIDFNKKLGSGDSIVLVVVNDDGTTTNNIISSPTGGSLINTSVTP